MPAGSSNYGQKSELSLLISEIKALNTVNKEQLNVFKEIKEFLKEAVPGKALPSERARAGLKPSQESEKKTKASEIVKEEKKKSFFEGGELISTSSLLKGAGLAGLVGALFTETGREFTAGILDGLGLKNVGDTFLEFANLLPTLKETLDGINNIIKFFMRDKLTSTADYDLSGIRSQEQFNKLSDKQKQELVKIREAGGAYDYTDEGLDIRPIPDPTKTKAFGGELTPPGGFKPGKDVDVPRSRFLRKLYGITPSGRLLDNYDPTIDTFQYPKPSIVDPGTFQQQQSDESMNVVRTEDGNLVGLPSSQTVAQQYANLKKSTYEDSSILAKKIPSSVFTESANPIDVRPPRLFASEIDQYEYDPYEHLKADATTNSIVEENNNFVKDAIESVKKLFERNKKLEEQITPSTPLTSYKPYGQMGMGVGDDNVFGTGNIFTNRDGAGTPTNILENPEKYNPSFGVSPTQMEKLGKTSLIDQESTKAASSVVNIQNSFNSQQTTSGGGSQESKTIDVNIARGAPNGAPPGRKIAVGSWT